MSFQYKPFDKFAINVFTTVIFNQDQIRSKINNLIVLVGVKKDRWKSLSL